MGALPLIQPGRVKRMSTKVKVVVGLWTLATGLAIYGAHQQDEAQALVTTPYEAQATQQPTTQPYHDEDTLVIPEGSVEPGLWTYLLDNGWRGRPDDGIEALYPPYDVECWEAEYDEVIYAC